MSENSTQQQCVLTRAKTEIGRFTQNLATEPDSKSTRLVLSSDAKAPDTGSRIKMSSSRHTTAS